MEALFWPLAVVVVVAGVAAWLQEQRTWQDVHAAAGYRPDSAVRLHHALRAAGVRSRYRAVGTGASFASLGNATNQTVKVLVHRDDLHRAREVAARLRSEG